MKVKTSIKAGGSDINHNEAVVRNGAKARIVKAKIQRKGLGVKTGVKAGGADLNHNETLARDA